MKAASTVLTAYIVTPNARPSRRTHATWYTSPAAPERNSSGATMSTSADCLPDRGPATPTPPRASSTAPAAPPLWSVPGTVPQPTTLGGSDFRHPGQERHPPRPGCGQSNVARDATTVTYLAERQAGTVFLGGT
jgi:hypothetical protein